MKTKSTNRPFEKPSYGYESSETSIITVVAFVGGFLGAIALVHYVLQIIN